MYMCTHITTALAFASVYIGPILVCIYLRIVLKSEHVWVLIFWLYCISCTYGKRKKKFTKNKRKRKEISGKSLKFIELLPSGQPSSRNENFVSTGKNLLKNRNWTFPVVRYFTWKLQSVTKDLGLTLVFMWRSAPRERFNRYFSGLFC